MNSVDSMLVTQNIDGLHNQEIRNSKVLMSTIDSRSPVEKVGFTPHIYEIHGNVYYMHSSKESDAQSSKFVRTPTVEEVEAFAKENNGEVLVPKCEENGEIMSPHCMCFDESYSERYYRYDTVKEYMKDADCLLVIGTTLQTSFAKSIVEDFLKREQPVIEFNLESAIKKGNNIQVLSKAEDSLPALFKEYYRLESETSTKSLS